MVITSYRSTKVVLLGRRTFSGSFLGLPLEKQLKTVQAGCHGKTKGTLSLLSEVFMLAWLMTFPNNCILSRKGASEQLPLGEKEETETGQGLGRSERSPKVAAVVGSCHTLGLGVSSLTEPRLLTP